MRKKDWKFLTLIYPPCFCPTHLEQKQSQSLISDLQDDPSFFLQELDVSSDDSVRHALSTVLENFGRIDIVVNNAGVQCVGPVAEVPLSMIQQTFNTNVFGPHYVRQQSIWKLKTGRIRNSRVSQGTYIPSGHNLKLIKRGVNLDSFFHFADFSTYRKFKGIDLLNLL